MGRKMAKKEDRIKDDVLRSEEGQTTAGGSGDTLKTRC